jgi:hypothetical protein
MEFTTQEQLDNIDEMVIQYLETIFDLMENIMDMLELRGRLNTD